MPTADQMPDELSPAKLLVLGDTKAGKSDWAFRAAEAGFNVLYLDGDVGSQCMKSMITKGRLSKAALSRIFYLRIGDYVDGNGDYQHFMADFFVAFATAGKFLWNDTLQRPFSLSAYKPEEEHEVWQIIPSRMTTDTLLVVDSLTALTQSILEWKADDLNEDLGNIEKVSREMYAGSGHKMTHFMTLLRATQSHLCVIGHPREYVKLEKPKGKIGNMQEKDMKIEWTKMVPVSTSNPHSLTIGKNFSDIGWIGLDAMGKRVIDFTATDSRVSGGHVDKKGDVDSLTFAEVARTLGCSVPTNPDPTPWLTRYGPGEYEVAGKKPAIVLGAKPTVESTGKALTDTLIQAASEVEKKSPLEPESSGTVPLKVGSIFAGLKSSGVERG